MGHSPAHAQKALSGKDIIWYRLKDLLCTYWNSFTVRLVDQDAAFVPAVADRIKGDVARCRDVIGLIVEDEAIQGGTVISPSTRIMLYQIADLPAQGGEVAELLAGYAGLRQAMLAAGPMNTGAQPGWTAESSTLSRLSHRECRFRWLRELATTYTEPALPPFKGG